MQGFISKTYDRILMRYLAMIKQTLDMITKNDKQFLASDIEIPDDAYYWILREYCSSQQKGLFQTEPSELFGLKVHLTKEHKKIRILSKELPHVVYEIEIKKEYDETSVPV